MTPAETLQRIGRRLWGTAWATPMSDATGVHVRTLQRIRFAAELGGIAEHSAGALAALRETLMEMLSLIDECEDPVQK